MKRLISALLIVTLITSCFSPLNTFMASAQEDPPSEEQGFAPELSENRFSEKR